MRISDWSSDVCSSDLAGAISIDLQTGASNGGDAEGDRFDGVERFIGTGFADALVGDGGDQILVGGAGGDRIDGAGGFDTAVYSGSAAGVKRSEGRRVGKGCGSTGRSRWWAYNLKKKYNR